FLDWRLLAMTAGVRWRLVLCALVGLLAVPVAIWRLSTSGQVIARVFRGEPLSALLEAIALIAGLVVLRSVLQYVRDEIGNGTGALIKARVRHQLYEHALVLGPGHF